MNEPTVERDIKRDAAILMDGFDDLPNKPHLKHTFIMALQELGHSEQTAKDAASRLFKVN